MRAEGGAAARAVGRGLVAAVDQPLVPELLDDPPAGFDVLVIEGDVGVLHVHPEGDAVGHGLPLVDVLEDGLLAHLVEPLDAVRFDLQLAGDAQLPLYLQLHGQAVGVPAALAGDLEALHGLVARDDVFKDAGQHVVDAGHAVGRGRAFIKGELRRTLPLAHALAEGILLLPELEDVLLQLGEAHFASYWFEHGSPSSTSFCSLRMTAPFCANKNPSRPQGTEGLRGTTLFARISRTTYRGANTPLPG